MQPHSTEQPLPQDLRTAKGKLKSEKIPPNRNEWEKKKNTQTQSCFAEMCYLLPEN